jgi:hypothetical protein
MMIRATTLIRKNRLADLPATAFKRLDGHQPLIDA